MKPLQARRADLRITWRNSDADDGGTHRPYPASTRTLARKSKIVVWASPVPGGRAARARASSVRCRMNTRKAGRLQKVEHICTKMYKNTVQWSVPNEVKNLTYGCHGWQKNIGSRRRKSLSARARSALGLPAVGHLAQASSAFIKNARAQGEHQHVQQVTTPDTCARH